MYIKRTLHATPAFAVFVYLMVNIGYIVLLKMRTVAFKLNLDLKHLMSKLIKIIFSRTFCIMLFNLEFTAFLVFDFLK